MSFHRLVTPAYFIASGGPLLAGYDYINNAGAGTPALADGPKSSGPNLGTYFVAWTDDGTSRHANRGLKALSQNTDILDDLLHRDLATPKVTADATPVVPVSTFTLVDTQGIYVGVPGTPNTTNGINTFVDILDSNDNEIIGNLATGARCRVTAIAGAAVGAGFAGPSVVVTFTVTPPIPIGQTYRIYYATRGNLAGIPVDGLSFIKVRAAHERDAATLDFERQVSRRAGVDVLALVAPILETPDGVRRPKSALMEFDVDPDGTVAGTHGFLFQNKRDAAGVEFMGRLVEDPADPLALARRLELGPSGLTGLGTLGTLAFFDAQTIAGGTASGIAKYVPFSGSAGQGDDYLRVHDKRTARTVLRSLNGRVYASVGDGTTTFGDFNGVSAITDAMTAFGAAGTLYIRVKPGVYDIAGASGPAIPSTLVVVVEGSDRGACVLQGATTDGQTFNVTGGQLVLKDVTLRLKAATTQGGVFVTSTSRVSVFNANVTQQKLVFTNVNPRAFAADKTFDPGTDEPTLFVDNSFLDMDGIVDATGAFPLVDVRVGDLLEHRGYVIRNSILRCTDHNAPFKITCIAAGVSRVEGVLFDRCRILLASTTDTGNYMTANCGALWIDPGTTFTDLEVDDITWNECKVFANHKGTGVSSVLLHIAPPHHRYGTGGVTGACYIGRVNIFGGYWAMPDVNTVHTAWWLDSAHTVMRGTRLRSTNKLTGTVTQDLAWFYVGGAAVTPADFASFTFHSVAGMQALNGDNFNTLFIENIELTNAAQVNAVVASGLGDIAFWAPSVTDVDGVFVRRIVDGTPAGGQLPFARILVRSNFSGKQSYARMLWGEQSNGFANGPPTMTTGGLISIKNVDEVTLTECHADHPFVIVGAPSNGIRCSGTNNVVRLTDCSVRQCSYAIYWDDTTFQGKLFVEGGTINGCSQGVRVECGTGPFFAKLNAVAFRNTTSYAIRFVATGANWKPNAGVTESSYFVITGCNMENCTTNPVKIESTTFPFAATGPQGVYLGNTALRPGSPLPADVYFSHPGAAVIATINPAVRGCETDWVYTYATNQPMLHNFGKLINGP